MRYVDVVSRGSADDLHDVIAGSQKDRAANVDEQWRDSTPHSHVSGRYEIDFGHATLVTTVFLLTTMTTAIL